MHCLLCGALRLLENVLLGTGQSTRWARRADSAPDDVWHAVTNAGQRYARMCCGASLHDVDVDVVARRPRGRKCSRCAERVTTGGRR